MIPGQVTVGAEQPTYAPADAITATVAIGLADDIRVADHQSGCTIVAIERLDGATWRMQRPCPLRSPTRLLELAVGSVTVARVEPPVGGWATGDYRVSLAYRLAQSAWFGAGRVAGELAVEFGAHLVGADP